MLKNENSNSDPRKIDSKASENFLSNSNLVALYTTLMVLNRIKAEIGLEAMLEYLDKYLLTIETHNPRFKSAVLKALSLINIEKIYKDMMLNESKGTQ